MLSTIIRTMFVASLIFVLIYIKNIGNEEEIFSSHEKSESSYPVYHPLSECLLSKTSDCTNGLSAPVSKEVMFELDKASSNSAVLAETKGNIEQKNTPTPTATPTQEKPTQKPMPTPTLTPILTPTNTPVPQNATTIPTPTNTPLPQPKSTQEKPLSLNSDIIFEMINNHRKEMGLPAYEKEDRLCALAKERGPELYDEIFVTGNIHGGLYARNLPYWITENMKYGADENSVFSWWLSSYIHRKAIESPNFQYSCGECYGNTCIQLFTSYMPK